METETRGVSPFRGRRRNLWPRSHERGRNQAADCSIDPGSAANSSLTQPGFYKIDATSSRMLISIRPSTRPAICLEKAAKWGVDEWTVSASASL